MTPLIHRVKSALRTAAGPLGCIRAATAVEYGLILSLIVLAMLFAFREVANSTLAMWGNVNNKVEAAR